MIDEYCRDCMYLNRESRFHPICDYIGRTGARRGCPSGTGCTKKLKRKERLNEGHHDDLHELC